MKYEIQIGSAMDMSIATGVTKDESDAEKRGKEQAVAFISFLTGRP